MINMGNRLNYKKIIFGKKNYFGEKEN
jgi:hypothetical protein